jgi:ribosome-binding factor A
MTRRTDRIGHLIQRELGDFIFREMSDQRVGFVTISRVEVTTDLSHAKVMVSVLGNEKEKRDSLNALAHAAAYMRNHLAKVLQTRTVPKLSFVEDKNLEHGFRINEVLKGLETKDKGAPGGEPEAEESKGDSESDGDEMSGKK